MTIDNTQDILDSRDIIERIEEMQAEHDDWISEDSNRYSDDWEDNDKLMTLKELAEQGEGSPDWNHGEILVRDSYFKKYAQELAEECGMVNPDTKWPNNCIDWDKAVFELQYDYFAINFDGIDYWIKA